MPIQMRPGKHRPALDPIVPHKRMKVDEPVEARSCDFRRCGKPISRYNSTSRCASCDDVYQKEEQRRREQSW